jgi:hypothetical protein
MELAASMFADVNRGRNLRRKSSTPETLVLSGTSTSDGALAKANGS